ATRTGSARPQKAATAWTRRAAAPSLTDINAVGMCGQGFMLGPGIGELLTRICLKEETDSDKKVLVSFDPYRQFTGMEAFK
ncbi:MAG: hypothetical protein R6V77_05445, partial [Candidatus Cloacimonadaceae bacterium]